MVSAQMLVAACTWVALEALDPFALSGTQIAQLQAAAKSMSI